MIFSRIHANATVSSDTVAVRCGSETRTWAELDHNIAAVARHLAPADTTAPVIVRIPNILSAPEVLIGAIMSGRTVIPVNPRVPAIAVGQIIERSGATTAIGTTADLADLPSGPDSAPFEIIDVTYPSYGALIADRLDLATVSNTYLRTPGHVLLTSSGTGGAPKPVLADFPSITGYLSDVLDLYDIDPTTDVWLAAAPITHSGGLATALGALVGGTTLSMLPAWSPVDFAAAVSEHGVTHTLLVPTMIASLLALPPSSIGQIDDRLKVLVSAAAPLPSSVREAIRSAMPSVRVGSTYGCTEGGSVTHRWFDGTSADDTAGTPCRGHIVQVRSTDSDGIGRIYVNGPSTVNAARGADGFAPTGDTGRFDSDGNLVLVGRVDEVIISGGYNIYPLPIEDLLRSFPGVRDAAIVGRDDETYGQVPVAYLASDGTSDLDLDVAHGVLHAYLSERVASYALPRRYEIVESIPTSPTGKTLKKEIPA